jgi:hypothetical protein
MIIWRTETAENRMESTCHTEAKGVEVKVGSAFDWNTSNFKGLAHESEHHQTIQWQTQKSRLATWHDYDWCFMKWNKPTVACPTVGTSTCKRGDYRYVPSCSFRGHKPHKCIESQMPLVRFEIFKKSHPCFSYKCVKQSDHGSEHSYICITVRRSSRSAHQSESFASIAVVEFATHLTETLVAASCLQIDSMSNTWMLNRTDKHVAKLCLTR